MTQSSNPLPAAIKPAAPDGNLTPRQARRLLIEMSLRKQRPGTGSSIEFLRRRTAMNPWPDLRDMLKGIRWCVVDGVATRAYMPERGTKDLDILVANEDGPEAIARLRQAGFTVVSELAVPGWVLRSPDGVEVDVLFGNDPWLPGALQELRADPAGYPVLALSYLVLMKLLAMRAQDLAHITRMLGLAAEADLDKVRAAVARYSPEDSEDLEAMIFLGKRELELPPDVDREVLS